MYFAVNFFVGLVAAMLATLPLGPVNLEIVQRTISRGFRHGALVAVGSCVTEMLWCGLAVFGTNLLFSSPAQEETVFLYFKIGSIPLLLVLGVLNLRKRVPRPKIHVKGFAEPAQQSAGSGVIVGASLNLLNPVLLAFWLAVSAYLKASKMLYDGVAEEIVYTLGVGGGTLLTGSIIAFFASRGNQRMSYRTRVYLTRGIGFTFLAFAMFQAYSLMDELIRKLIYMLPFISG